MVTWPLGSASAGVVCPARISWMTAAGVGEYVGGAGQIAEALKLGAAGTDPIGYALLLGAADWRRCGMTRPVPASLLVQLAEPHLDQRGQARLADHDACQAGLDWATREPGRARRS
jgi:hypothetical protein